MKLDSLPATDSKFWKDADTQKIVMPEVEPCEHEFKRISGTQVQCKKCGIGFYTIDNYRLKKGHIYKGKKLII